MRVTSETSDSVTIVMLHGDSLDAGNVADFKREMAPLIEGSVKMVMDLSAVQFVDSSGLGALISCLRDTNGRKGDFRLSNMSRSVLALFELMRMHRVFSIHETAEGAVASFS